MTDFNFTGQVKVNSPVARKFNVIDHLKLIVKSLDALKKEYENLEKTHGTNNSASNYFYLLDHLQYYDKLMNPNRTLLLVNQGTKTV